MKKQAFKEDFFRILFFLSAATAIVAIILICLFIFMNGLPFIGKYGIGRFLLGKDWSPSNSPASFGILPMILGSLLITAGAIVVGVPTGIFTSVFMVYYCPKPLYRFLKSSINLMAAIPSIVYGFFGLQLLVPWIRSFSGNGMSVLTASLLLGIMILPTIISLSESAIRTVPASYYSGSLALGASHERTIFSVILPAAKSGVFSAIILGIGRAIGETMAVILVAGNQPIIPSGLFEGTRTMTTNIVLEMAYASGQHREALIATSAILFIFILMINACFAYVKGKSVHD
ncbi:phosphate ABC transporter permease subunit PstC [Streptococcus didelphis]|uniref:Phosphate transport system permease protein n=1 Tax=Streptococcus didelphis TaxID=102886 RepID=A0ABY9LHY2_9STRE|nr:phosphate ABC transporter permease subunit PstC [Streptococcus didelphis]WMB28460.1 phosphate ABC transporter permease subunit PstC [Streptococcus didelphis]WMB29136.1 phosphate ABC transporter permease subunit PstC [Streptococcus didelphis]